MGFTRSFTIDYSHEAFRSAWPQLVADARRIVDELSNRGVAIRGGLGTGDPIVTVEPAEDSGQGFTYVFPSGAIWLNGDPDLEEDYESFRIAPEPGPPKAGWTKTGYQPYDVAVQAILIRLKVLAGEAADVPSADTSGEYEHDPTLQEGRALLHDLGLTTDLD